ncbi:MAG: hypothetical protein KF852_13915 [Saprospiraceae bacterium]|nr:hypothetical protein [Saprospiraceae bacterium]
MNKISFIVCLLLLVAVSGAAQSVMEPPPPGKLKFTLGLGFDEAIILKSQLPTIGIGYDSKLSERFFLTFNILSHYRRNSDVVFDRVLNSPVADILALGAWGPFMTDEEVRLIENKGVKAFPSQATIKSLAIPADVGIIYYVMNGHRHKLGINVGFNLMYQNHNYFRDYLPVEYIQWLGSAQPAVPDIYLSVPTEFRSISPGFNARFIYELHAKDTVLGLRIGSYDVLDFGSRLFSSSLTVHELTLFYGLKLKK